MTPEPLRKAGESAEDYHLRLMAWHRGEIEDLDKSVVAAVRGAIAVGRLAARAVGVAKKVKQARAATGIARKLRTAAAVMEGAKVAVDVAHALKPKKPKTSKVPGVAETDDSGETLHKARRRRRVRR